jgi:hypothetical protein
MKRDSRSAKGAFEVASSACGMRNIGMREIAM